MSFKEKDEMKSALGAVEPLSTPDKRVPASCEAFRAAPLSKASVRDINEILRACRASRRFRPANVFGPLLEEVGAARTLQTPVRNWGD